jgi:5,10-methylenetetrahydromethanopterin reductase
MNFDIGIFPWPPPTFHDYIDYAKLLDEIDLFDTLWIGELYFNREGIVAGTAFAMNTNRIKIGFGVLSMYYREPAILASALTTLDELSNGRVVVGIGPGDKTTLSTLGLRRSSPLTATKEYATILRKLFDGKKISIDGKFYHYKNAQLKIPISHRIPIWIGARGPKMLKLAGAIGDGVMIDFSHPLDIKWAADLVREGAREAGRDPKKIEIAPYVGTSVSRNNIKGAIEKGRHMATLIGATEKPETYSRHGIDFEKEVLPIKKLLKNHKIDEAMAACPEKLIEIFTNTGDPKTVTQRFQEIIDTKAVSRIVIGEPLGPNIPESIKIISEEILPNLKY